MKQGKLYDVLGIGVAAVDDLLYVPAYPEQNVKVPVTGRERHGGGPACTAMAAVGSLQGRAAFAARFGNDELSRYIEESLNKRGVDTTHVIRDAQAAPYHSVIVVDSRGSRNVFYDASMYRLITDTHLPASLIKSAELVLVDHVADPALIDVVQKVRSLHVPLVGDIEGRSDPARCLAGLVDHLIVPEEFAVWATGVHDIREACASLAEQKRLSTVVTAGNQGCYCCFGIDNVVTHVPAFAVDSFDTNGCGDTFHGAFALAIVRNFAPLEAIRFASAAAALKAFGGGGSRRGWDALPTLDDIIGFLRCRRSEHDCSDVLNKVENLRTPKEGSGH